MSKLAQLSITTVVNTAQCESAFKIIRLENTENLLMNHIHLYK